MSKRIVFILGAGFSSEAGAPLVDDFISSARYIYANKQNSLDPGIKDSFENVFRYHGQLSKAKTKVNFDVDNIEEFFSILDMNCSYVQNEDEAKHVKAVRNDLISVIIKTLDVCIDSKKYGLYINFIKSLFDNYKQFSFITFNYDLILEKLLETGRCDYNYCVNPEEHEIKDDQKKILKLHGSANWRLCGNPECNYLNILHWKEIRAITCKYDSKATMPLLIPPTWNKRIDNKYISAAWYYAFEEIKSANNIIIIGYSLPETDIYFRNFLTLALNENINLERITIVNKNSAIEERFLRFFEPNFARRYLSFIPRNFRNVNINEMINGDVF